MVLLEIEQKFSFSVSNYLRFRSNRGNPPFRTLKFLDNRTFTDAYYDINMTLARNGLWLRTRNGIWLAKKRVHGDFIRSSFEEINKVTDIHALVRQHFQSCPGAEENFGLREMCRMTTSRESYVINGLYLVTLDTMAFGHMVGEVEVSAEDTPEDIKAAHKDIDNFMSDYAWFFGRQNVKGKLTAYFEKFGTQMSV